MPYANIEEAKEAGFPVKIDDVDLTLEQINHLADIYDALREEPEVEEPMAAAISRFRELYEKKDGKWVAREKEEEEEKRKDSSAKDTKRHEGKYEPGHQKPEHQKTGSGIISLSAVSLPDGGLRDSVIPDQTILHTGTWRDGSVEITREILEKMLANYRVLSDEATAPYLEPFVKSDHSLSVNDIIGHWENLRIEDIEIPTATGSLEVAALIGDEHITNPEALEKIKRGEWTRRSAEFVERFRDEATGEEFEWVLLGSAYVDIPEITSIPPVHVPIAAAATLEEAVVEMNKVRGAENEEPENQNTSEIKRLVKEAEERAEKAEAEKKAAEDEAEKLRRRLGDDKELQRLREDCENLRREAAQRREEVRRLERDSKLEELRRPGGNGLALPEAVIALVREGMEKFDGGERVTLRRGDGEVEMGTDDFIVALAGELRDIGLVDTRVLTALEPPFEDGEKKAERLAKERGHIKTG